MYFDKIKNDMDTLQDMTGLFVSYLEKETSLKESICYIYHTKDVESNDDAVDITEVSFLLNVYSSDKLISKYKMIYKALTELGFLDIKLIDTVKENDGYNTAFVFFKLYETN